MTTFWQDLTIKASPWEAKVDRSSTAELFGKNMSETYGDSEKSSELLSVENESVSATYEGVHGPIAHIQENRTDDPMK